MKFFILVLFLFLKPTLSHADYVATGQIKGWVCKGFGIEVCDYQKIYAVDDSSGKLYNVKRVYKKVNEFTGKSCTLYIKPKSNEIISKLFRKMKNPNFYTKNKSGKFKKVDVEYLRFSCFKR